MVQSLKTGGWGNTVNEAECVSGMSLPTCNPMDCSPPGSSVHGISPGKNTGVGCYSLLQGIFHTQGLNPCRLHWQEDSLRLGHQGSPSSIQRKHGGVVWCLTEQTADAGRGSWSGLILHRARVSHLWPLGRLHHGGRNLQLGITSYIRIPTAPHHPALRSFIYFLM